MQFTMGRAVMEQSASSEQEIAMLIIGQRIAPSMTSLTNFSSLNGFLYLIFVSFRGIT